MALKLGYAFNRATALAPEAGQRKGAFSDFRVSENKPPASGRAAPAMGPPTTPVAPKQRDQFGDNRDKQQQREKEPPLPRQNTKTQPPSPPQVIRDISRIHSYTRLGFLGEGGFARVYEALDTRGGRHAIKVVTKSSLKTKKAKTKLYAEIKIHRMLDHPNIVNFRDCFEDSENVYMTLELCDSGSLMDLLRRRKRFTEPEARFFMVQLIGACHYMHNNQVIHRDLKLGNLFLDRKMNVKVGDFGLAALIENPGERKKTICGTPNYIAPEVLFDTANGHSFEVDTWSNGVILYTLLIGKPPFQTKDVKTIYQRIKDNDYEFPHDRPVDSHAKELIRSILTPDPRERPQLEDIIDHKWFTHGIVPSAIPPTALDFAPKFIDITLEQSRINLTRLRRQCLLDEDQTTTASVSAQLVNAPIRSRAAGEAALAQQEREFHKAVQPGSPISALLKSAREPLVVTNGERPRPDGLPVQRNRLVTPVKSSLHLASTGLDNIDEEDEADEPQVRRELESQKARIVAQMAPENAPAADGEATVPAVVSRARLASTLGRDPRGASSTTSTTTSDGKKWGNSRLPATMGRAEPKQLDDIVARVKTLTVNAPSTAADTIVVPKQKVASTSKTTTALAASAAAPTAPSQSSLPSTSELVLEGEETYDIISKMLGTALDARDAGKQFRDPKLDADLPRAKVFIVSWVDYCNKYGMGYALTDGSVGVYFNDTTSLVLAADKEHLDFMQPRKSSSTLIRKNMRLSNHSEDVKNKVYLLKHFEKYMMSKLYGDYDYTFVDATRTTGMSFVQRYFRTKHGMVFLFSHDTIQFNFNDHTKMIISQSGLAISQIDREYKLTHYTLSGLMAQSLDPAKAGDKETSRLVDKLRFLRETLRQAFQEAKNPAKTETAQR